MPGFVQALGLRNLGAKAVPGMLEIETIQTFGTTVREIKRTDGITMRYSRMTTNNHPPVVCWTITHNYT